MTLGPDRIILSESLPVSAWSQNRTDLENAEIKPYNPQWRSDWNHLRL